MPSTSWGSFQFRHLSWLLIGIAITAVSLCAQPVMPTATGLPEESLPGLKELLESAALRARSPEALRATAEVALAEARKVIGASVLWPSVGGNARYAVSDESTVNSGSRATNRSSGFFYELSARQPIFHWGALHAQAEREKLGLKGAERDYAEMYRTLVLGLRKSYLALIAQKANLKALKNQLTLDQANLADQKEKLRVGAITGGELAGTQLAVDQRQLEIERTAADFEYAKGLLARIAGMKELSDEAIPDELPRPSIFDANGSALLQAFVRGGVENTFQAQKYAIEIKRSEQSFVVARHRLHPKFSLFVGYDVRNETQADVNRINQVAVAATRYGVLAEWSIFDGFATKGEQLAAKASKRANEQLLQAHIDAATDAARYQLQQLGFAGRALDFAENALSGALAGLGLIEKEHEAGRASLRQVDDARAAVLRAQAAILSTRAEYLMHWAEFVSLVGADPAMNNLPSRYVR